MSIQTQTENTIRKLIQNYDFFGSTVYERYDLRDVLKNNERFIIRQGDLIITNKMIIGHAERGLTKAYLRRKNGYETFRDSHVIMPLHSSTIIFHNEHGLVVIPESLERLYFYTFNLAFD